MRRAIIMARNYANHEETIARDALIRRHRCQSRRLLRGVRIPADRCKHRCKLRQRRGGGCRRSGGDGCQKRMLKSCRARNLPQDVADYLATNRPPEISQKNDADCQKITSAKTGLGARKAKALPATRQKPCAGLASIRFPHGEGSRSNWPREDHRAASRSVVGQPSAGRPSLCCSLRTAPRVFSPMIPSIPPTSWPRSTSFS